ncbi:insulinase family protein [Methylicorpusculum oleiharenae]|uniref:M16 family metallopeptidase n=1 Tax=Methylicorpusculum oleiharenae TaxID=1338687 RepID=UPI00135AD57D|nr:pitrilysin family protein [Methylicorpusculum oleiharenae]MCD2449631.1 insulinase family protein [Methylicorpusculum oleiharenae]
MRIFLLLVLMTISPLNWAAAKIETWQTPKGSRVFYIYAPDLPMADIRITFDAGSARDGAQHGLAALTSGLLDTGAGKWSADELARRFESVGANFGTSVSRDTASLSLRTLTDPPLFDKAVETMKTILIQPVFNQADFEREKNRTLAALKHRESSPAALADLTFNKVVYGDHPYAHSSAGEIETVTALTADDLKKFYKQYYVSANALVVIVGDLTKKQAAKTAEDLLADLPAGQKPTDIPEVSLPKHAKLQHIEFPSTQTHVLSGLPGMHRKDEDYFALYVGNHILGGGGLVSRLFEEVREKRGLAYGASSSFAPMFRKGAFSMGLQTRNDQTQQALDVMTQTLADFIETGPTEAELDAAKKNLTGGFVMRFDTNSKLAGYAEMIGFYGLPLDYLDTFPEKVLALTVNDIKDAFKRRVNPKLLQTVTVGEAVKTREK